MPLCRLRVHQGAAAGLAWPDNTATRQQSSLRTPCGQQLPNQKAERAEGRERERLMEWKEPSREWPTETPRPAWKRCNFFDGFVLVLFFFFWIVAGLPGCADAEPTSVLASKRRVDVGFASKMDAMRRRRMRCGRKTDPASAPPKAGANATV